ncbi:hypothetical protein R2F61_07515 [Mollicutes bacterium LVI A0078]|nr:hypothetical protein RZE84_07290 [Mollicutes bacterium LVI A0075]WOO90572.1 hypothetical protein R2F61_07515 [Mollicutes bacterium LVI A0078]
MAIKGREVVNTIETKEVEGYIQATFSPKQWSDIRSEKIKSEDITTVEQKVYRDKKGVTTLDLNVKQDEKDGGKSIKVKVVGDEDVTDFLGLFNSVDRVFGVLTYEQEYMKGRKYIDLDLKNYDNSKTIDSKPKVGSALSDMM